ncbi:tyrosine-protein kinase RYK-like [Paramacrobiotus metropolitanus]|uniref:tyrosine-protein kinase RYK-like n=1 Tax=Paramacrobiotus metropolitanus TaxID=2943436 RepID=UPI0024457383|nr:tyrosine-protein kinase RYK-like [Paramacrobiotus metropolitanus]
MHFICFLLAFASAKASVDLFTTVAENKKLIGVAGEIYYLRDLQINEQSANYNLHIKANVSSLQFFWRSKGALAKYSLDVSYTNQATTVLEKWSSNISAAGVVPKRLQSFIVTLPCAVKADVAVDVIIQLNITIGQEVTRLALPRRRFCSAKPQADAVSTIEDPALNVSRLSDDDKYFNSVQLTQPTTVATNRPVITAVIIASLFTVFASFIVLICCKSRPKPGSVPVTSDELLSPPLLDMQLREVEESNFSPQPRVYPSLQLQPNIPESDQQLYDDNYSVRAPSALHPPSLVPTSLIQPSLVGPVSVDPIQRNPLDFEISGDYVECGELIQSGAFGVVRMGYLKLPGQVKPPTDIMIKTVKPDATPMQKRLLLEDGLMLRGLQHPNVSPLLAYVDRSESPMVLYVGLGQLNLKIFFLKPINRHGLGISHLTKFAVDVINGLEYLHSKNIVHKDLALRNCLISPDLKVEISDNALARDLFPEDYHCLGDNENRPLKWMAYESLTVGEFHRPSDIWSYGVLVWELLTYGDMPYALIDPFEMELVLKDGWRPPPPTDCPEDLRKIMLACWTLAPESRPLAEQLNFELTAFNCNLMNYV